MTYPLSLHDALPISSLRNWLWQRRRRPRPAQRRLTLPRSARPFPRGRRHAPRASRRRKQGPRFAPTRIDRKSTRLNSSHEWISYAVFCLKKKKRTSDESGNKRHNGLNRTLSANRKAGATKGVANTPEIQGVIYKAEPTSMVVKVISNIQS